MNKTHWLASMLLALLILSGCSSREVPEAVGTEVNDGPGASNGITVFGDARLGFTFN